jgi:hypothetical protein
MCDLANKEFNYFISVYFKKMPGGKQVLQLLHNIFR